MAINDNTVFGDLHWNFVILFVAFDMFQWSTNMTMSWILRHLLMKHYFKFDHNDILKIESYRSYIDSKKCDDNSKSLWTTSTLNNLKTKYGKKLIYVDIISRKVILHIPIGMAALIFYNFVGNFHRNEWFVYCILIVPIKMILYYCAMNVFPNNAILRIMAFGGGTRIRDGHSAYINSMIGAFTSYIGQIYMLVLMRTIYADPNDIQYMDACDLLTKIIYVGLISGDASGELIGSPFGKHRFKVYGFGEINNKSLEGCCAVFVFTLCPSYLMVYTSIYYNQNWLYLMVLIGSFVVVIVEAVSFRGTDNAFIPVVIATFYTLVFAKYDLH